MTVDVMGQELLVLSVSLRNDPSLFMGEGREQDLWF